MKRGHIFIKVLVALIAVFSFNTFLKAADEFSIIIDAEKDAWYENLVGPDDGHIVIPYLSYNQNGAPDSEEDLSAEVWVAYDETYFYIYEEVKDDFVICNNTTAGNKWRNDCLELKFDPDPNFGPATEVIPVRLTALGTDGAEEPTGVDNMDAEGQFPGGEEGDYYRNLEDDGYILEMRVPWDKMVMTDGREPIVGVGEVFGFAIMNHDNDVADREGSIEWAAVLDDAVWNNTQLLGTVEFLEENKLKLIPENYITGTANENASWYIPIPEQAAVEENKTYFPTEYNLFQNYPNPFNPTTHISFEIPKSSHVKLAVFNTIGEEIVTLVNEKKSAGFYDATFNANEIPSGIYFYKLETGGAVFCRKMTLVK